MGPLSATDQRPAKAGALAPDHAQFSRIVGVVRSGGEFRLIALQRIAPGERMFKIEGDSTPRPSRYSVQVGDNLHIDLSPGHTTEEIMDRFFWRFMNHACDPNSFIRGREVKALRAIQPWEDVTFDYNSTEYNMAEPFTCRCGSSRCHGTIRGFKHLGAGEQERLRPVLAHHLLRYLEPTVPPFSLPQPA